MHHVKGKKPVTKDQILYDSIYMSFPEQAKTGSRLVAQGQELWGERRDINEHRASFQGEENALKLTVVMVTQLCEYTKTNELQILNV